MKSLLEKKNSAWATASLEKVVAPEKIEELAARLRGEGKSIATLNGSFDLLHAGHLHILYSAAQAGDVLIVALNTDRSIQEYKSPTRPIVPLEDRLQMVAALGFVDYVTWFDETDPRTLLARIAPDVHINGADWGSECIEAKTVEAAGGQVRVVELIPGSSTSNLIKRVIATCD